MGLPAHSRTRHETAYWAKSLSGRNGSVSDSVRELAREIRAIMDTAPEFKPASHPQRIAVMSGHGLNAIHLSSDALWLMALRQRGHHGMGIICDGGLPSCEFNFRGDGSMTPRRISAAFTPWANSFTCRDCGHNAAAVLAATNAPVQSIPAYGAAEDLQAALRLADRVPVEEIRTFRYKDVPVGDHAFSSTLRSTLRGVVDFDDRNEVWVYRRHLASSILLTDRLNRLIDRERPDKIVGVHGVYLMHGTMADVCKARSIPAVIYGFPYRKGTVWLSHEETYHRSLVDEPTSHWDTETMDDTRRALIVEYLKSRETGGRDNVNYHPNPILDRENVAKSIGLTPGKPLVSMFTNVIWDAQILYPSNAFENIFDWVYFTIDYFRSRPDLQLVIRIHPAETKGGYSTRQPLYPEIMGRYPELPPNIFVLPAESDVGSYTLAEMSTACLIFGTKMGVEIAARGIPVVVAGETFNRGKGFTYDVETKVEYRALLDKITEIPLNPPEMIDRALKFAHYLFFRRMMDLPLFGDNLWRAARQPGEKFYTFSSMQELAEGRCRPLDIICNGILHGEPLFDRA